MYFVFDLLSPATAFLLRVSIITHSPLCIDLVRGNALVVLLLDFEKGSNTCLKEILESV